MTYLQGVIGKVYRCSQEVVYDWYFKDFNSDTFISGEFIKVALTVCISGIFKVQDILITRTQDGYFQGTY